LYLTYHTWLFSRARKQHHHTWPVLCPAWHLNTIRAWYVYI